MVWNVASRTPGGPSRRDARAAFLAPSPDGRISFVTSSSASIARPAGVQVRAHFAYLPPDARRRLRQLRAAVRAAALPWHKNDYATLPNEDRVLDALRPFAIPPGDYVAPRASSMQEMRSPDFVEKWKKGPVVMLTVMPNGEPSMGKPLAVDGLIYALLTAGMFGWLWPR